MLCLPITESGSVAPWRISPAGDEHSARITRRMEEARHQREVSERHHQEESKPSPRGTRPPRKSKKKRLSFVERRLKGEN